MPRKLSTAEVARILDVRESRVREMVRSGLCRPTRQGRGYAFSFQDLVVLRTAEGLIQQKVPAARVRRSLSKLLDALPDDRPLSGLRVFADGKSLAVREGDASWDPETGQILLDFDVDQLAEQVDELRNHIGAGPGEKSQARQEFDKALELEEDDPAAAHCAYSKALDLDPELVDAYINLGRLAHESGDPQEAARLYHLALEYSADDPVIHFNLALALEDTQGIAPAISHYERAIELDSTFADAHYNLAGLYEQVNRPTDALRHYHAYKKLTES